MEVVQIMGDVCIDCTIRIPLLVFIGSGGVSSHNMQLRRWPSALKSIVDPVVTVEWEVLST